MVYFAEWKWCILPDENGVFYRMPENSNRKPSISMEKLLTEFHKSHFVKFYFIFYLVLKNVLHSVSPMFAPAMSGP